MLGQKQRWFVTRGAARQLWVEYDVELGERERRGLGREPSRLSSDR